MATNLNVSQRQVRGSRRRSKQFEPVALGVDHAPAQQFVESLSQLDGIALHAGHSLGEKSAIDYDTHPRTRGGSSFVKARGSGSVHLVSFAHFISMAARHLGRQRR